MTSAAADLAAASAALFGKAGNDIIVGNLGMYGLIALYAALSRRMRHTDHGKVT